MAIIKKSDKNVREDVEKEEHLYTAGGCKLIQPLLYQFEDSSKLKIELS